MAGYRGHLLFPFLGELSQLDTVAQQADPDGAGALTVGQDPDFHEPVQLAAPGGSGPGATNRREKSPTIKVRCQVEYGRQAREAAANGTVVDSQVTLCFHFSDLEAAGMVGADGHPTIRLGDRLVALYRSDNGALVQTMKPPLFVTSLQPSGFGLSGLSRNLLLVGFDDRVKAPT